MMVLTDLDCENGTAKKTETITYIGNMRSIQDAWRIYH
jgi:hypothetical protein